MALLPSALPLAFALPARPAATPLLAAGLAVVPACLEPTAFLEPTVFDPVPALRPAVLAVPLPAAGARALLPLLRVPVAFAVDFAAGARVLAAPAARRRDPAALAAAGLARELIASNVRLPATAPLLRLPMVRILIFTFGDEFMRRSERSSRHGCLRQKWCGAQVATC